MAKSDLYKAAGVDIDLATSLLKKVKADLASTRRPEMLSPIGGFGGLFQIDLSKYEEPVMVSSIDGVGTKLMIAAAMQKYDTVGCDIVNHCINDISVQGAEPVRFTRMCLPVSPKRARPPDVRCWAAKLPKCPACTAMTSTWWA